VSTPTSPAFDRIPGHIALGPTYQLRTERAVIEWALVAGLGTVKVHAAADMGYQDEGPTACDVLGKCWHDSRVLGEAAVQALRSRDEDAIRSWMIDEYVDVLRAMEDAAASA
jgi:hypothetical protein